MPSEVTLGASRGLGIFINLNNTVIRLVRSKSVTEEKVKEELPERTNIDIMEADITDFAARKVRNLKDAQEQSIDAII
ncbi:uncharacterized protein N7529_006742 [Penicillium soppii]|uniref:uncharacterized protein n=1 Tax=Penicillium soppii TaxID=69789 RepID=UPI0025498480|nr:uncharacterized protein N7529_006742 [Penicillium soppii]KAJ5864826.1 hypothetical protein N7529_006742 [Penicillium soppii]